MSATGKSLLVPIRVEALVIDDKVIATALPTDEGVMGEVLPGDGKWSPKQVNYAHTLKRHGAATPEPFFGAERKFKARETTHLVLGADSNALPKNADRGVYVRWVLPPALRHAAKDLAYPPIPDQWLVVRMARRMEAETEVQCEAWFIDSSVVSDDGPATTIARSAKEGQAKRIAANLGQAVNLRDYSPETFANRQRVTLTATGHGDAHSPTFATSLMENRHCLSLHDSLAELRTDGALPKDLVISYAVTGWFRESAKDPLVRMAPQMPQRKSFTLDGLFHFDLDRGDISPRLRRAFLAQDISLGHDARVTQLEKGTRWSIVCPSSDLAFLAQMTSDVVEVNADPGGSLLAALDLVLPGQETTLDLQGRACVFHGMTAFVNYWHGDTYKGPMLGYPGAPDAHGAARGDRPPLKIGMGHAAGDALVALVANGKSASKTGSAAWKALEAIMHHHTSELADGWDQSAWLDRVHQNWFRPIEGGKRWTIIAKARRPGLDPANEDKSAQIKATEAQRQALRKLNADQAELDRMVADRQAYQQAFHAHWQRLCRAKNQAIFAEEEALQALTAPIQDLAKRIAQLRAATEGQVHQLGADLRDHRLLLQEEPAPRYWMPSDPVVMIQNYGNRSLQNLPTPLPCRLETDFVTEAGLAIDGGAPQKFQAQPMDLPGLDTLLSQVGHGHALGNLLAESRLFESLVTALAKATLPENGAFRYAQDWEAWRVRTQSPFTQPDAEATRDRVRFFAKNKELTATHALIRVWGQQPWSPLYLDWEVTWRPYPDEPGKGCDIQGWAFGQVDYEPQGQPPQNGHTLRGRSPMTPVNMRLLNEPLATLRALLRGRLEGDQAAGDANLHKVAELLSDLAVWWDQDLKEIESGGLMGQALTGLQQHFLGRDLRLPRMHPDPELPWNHDPESPFNDAKAAPFLANHAQDPSPLMAPPSLQHQVPFSMLRGGSLTIEALWLIDDFGQWADLLGGSSAGKSSGAVINPHAAWPKDRFGSHLVVPPRIVQPTRLQFRFAGDDPGEPHNPIRGWVFYNYLDQALAVCDAKGRLLGELAVVDHAAGPTVRWSNLSAEAQAPEAMLEAWLQPLKQPAYLGAFLDFLDHAMARIRPAEQALGGGFIGRPLALVEAQIGLDLFGHEWTDPAATAATSSGLGECQWPVRLGDAAPEDGLLGYYQTGTFTALTPAHGKLPPGLLPTETQYITQDDSSILRVGIGRFGKLTLLMDPLGSVTARCGLLPSKDIRLDEHQIKEAFAQFELSFQVGPILTTGDVLSLPTPPDDGATWLFHEHWQSEAAAIEPWTGAAQNRFTRTRSHGGRLILRKLDATSK